MKQKTLAALDILAPTWGGLISYLVLVILTVVSYQWQALHPYLAPIGSWHLASRFTNFLTGFMTNFFGERAGSIVLGIFWGVVGLFVYIMVLGVAILIRDVDEALEEREFVWPKGSDPNKPLEDFLARGFFQIAVAVLLVAYVAHIAPFIQDFLTVKYPAGQSLLNLAAIKSLLEFTLVEMLALHIGTILLRLTILRRRLVA
ncbi:MAG TPA: hypothetical protein VLG37_00400 [Candidatus Saccharimonadales bacterium]|nr:hypothetical protein [Candidatus Saccharimonadales bacterium]